MSNVGPVALMCQWCGRPFFVKSCRATSAMFCSARCQNATRLSTSITKLMSRIDKRADGCWIWLGARDPLGYGHLIAEGRKALAHRFVYTLIKGPIPIGLVLDHLCGHTSCVNPEHLDPVTQRENMRRGQKCAQTHCKRGHLLELSNLEKDRIARGHRICSECRRIRGRAYRKTMLARRAQVTA